MVIENCRNATLVTQREKCKHIHISLSLTCSVNHCWPLLLCNKIFIYNWQYNKLVAKCNVDEINANLLNDKGNVMLKDFWNFFLQLLYNLYIFILNSYDRYFFFSNVYLQNKREILEQEIQTFNLEICLA